MKSLMLTVAALSVAASAAEAQQWQGEVHGNYARTTQTHANSWGAGAQMASTWGAKKAPVQLVTSLAGDWQQQENSGPSQWTLGYDATIQPGGQSAFTPYAGGSISANWLRGGGAPDGTLLGLQYIIGLQVKPEAQSAMTLKFEVRPGYVRTQEHSVTGRFGVDWSM
jgi:opacity protein-like surface antigen